MLSIIIVAQQKNDNLLGDLSKGKQQTDFAFTDHHFEVDICSDCRSFVT